MYHPRFKGKHYEIGQKQGNIFKKNGVRFSIKLDSFQREFGRESNKVLKEYFPEVTEEIRGITDVIEYDNELFTSWLLCMGCCLYIVEGQHVETRGCTAFSFTHKGQIYHARNNDLPPFLKNISKSICYKPKNKNSFILNTSAFINGEEGINASGLVAAMTFVMPKVEEIKPGINSVFLVRYLLENCKTVQEAVKTLKKLPIASSCNILLTDKKGDMVVVECNPFKIHLRYPEKSVKGENFIITVNHFSSDEMRRHDASDQNVYFSQERYQTVYDALKDSNYNDNIEHIKKILSGQYGFMCQYDKALNFDTIWASIFDISNEKIYRAEGNPRKTKFIEDTRFLKYIKKD